MILADSVPYWLYNVCRFAVVLLEPYSNPFLLSAISIFECYAFLIKMPFLGNKCLLATLYHDEDNFNTNYSIYPFNNNDILKSVYIV